MPPPMACGLAQLMVVCLLETCLWLSFVRQGGRLLWLLPLIFKPIFPVVFFWGAFLRFLEGAQTPKKVKNW